MSTNSINFDDKKIVILAINSVSIALSKILSDRGGNVSFLENNQATIKKYRDSEENSLPIIGNIDFNPKDIDYIICSTPMDFLEKNDQDLLDLMVNYENKIYQDYEIIANLLPGNIFIGIIGKGYGDMIASILNFSFENKNINLIKLPLEENEGESYRSLDLLNENIFIVDNYNVKLLKNMKFDSVCFLKKDNDENFDKLYNILSSQDADFELLLNIDDASIKDFYISKQTNQNFHSKAIPASLVKIPKNGCSYIDNTIYYYQGENSSFVLPMNEYSKFSVFKLSLMAALFLAKKLELNPKDVVENIANYRYRDNVLDCVEARGNLLIINNMWADSKDILEAPFEVQDNVYAIFVTNGRQENYFRKFKYKKVPTRKILVDVLSVCKEEEYDDMLVCANMEEAFQWVLKDINEGESEGNSTIIVTPVNYGSINKLYYATQAVKFGKLVSDLLAR